jgi:hypothetical protein
MRPTFTFLVLAGRFTAKTELAARPAPSRVMFPRKERRFRMGVIGIGVDD